MDYQERYKFWLENEYFSEEAKAELRAIANDQEEIKDRFYKELEFGTGGLRGKIAMGTNRMNIYTVSRLTQGLANYLIEKAQEEEKEEKKEAKKASQEKEREKEKEKEREKSFTTQEYLRRGVVIAHDCRHKSREFAETTALVLAANQIKVYLFEDIRPTPELSFAVIHLQAMAGIVITASHNPPEYNGYKVYGPDGGQVIPEIADRITEHINRLTDYSLIKKIDYSTALKQGLLKIIGAKIDRQYLKKVKELSLRSLQEIDPNIKIVYTPLHGAGYLPVRTILQEKGFTNLFMVEEQTTPDPNFSTVESPNPENPSAFILAKQLAQQIDAEIIIATDPDADRLGLAIKNPDYSMSKKVEQESFPSFSSDPYTILNGNQVGVLLLHYILSTKQEHHELPPNGFIVKTIVTSDMSRVIAADFGVETYETLTGFKFICHQARQVEEKEKKQFLFGYEESIGYLTGTFVRDKDGIISALLICEMAAYYYRQKKNLLQVLENLYQKYGYYQEEGHSIYLEGMEGEQKMAKIMEGFRKELPSIPGMEISRYDDVLAGISYNLKSGQTENLTLPSSDVLKIIFTDGSWYCLRPSGTEPKIKIYFSFSAPTPKETQQKLNQVKSIVLQKIDSLLKNS